MALNPYDEQAIARIFNDVLDERERKRHPHVDLNHLIMEVRSTADPNWHIARRREAARELLESIELRAEPLVREIRAHDQNPSWPDAPDELIEQVFYIIRDARRFRKDAEERGYGDLVSRATALCDALEDMLNNNDTTPVP